jgi:hypothetical protein
MTKSTRRSSASANKIFDASLKRILGPGVQARIKADAVMPVRFPGNDGIYFDPNWQDDIIIAGKPTQ